MGEGITVKCRNCSATQDFVLGVGMEYSSLEGVIRDLRPNFRAEVQGILQNHQVSRRDYEWRIYQCENCRRLYDRFWVQLMFDGAQVFETVYRCEECGGQLDYLRNLDQVSDIPCPYCGEKALSLGDDFLWD